MAEKFSNVFQTRLTVAMDASTTSMTVADAAPVALRSGEARFRLGDELLIATIPADGVSPWTVVRGAEGTVALAHAVHPVFGVVRHVLTAGALSAAVSAGVASVTKASLGLESVDNTADSAKPVSTAQQAALDAKAPTASPTLTGVVTVPTQTAGNSTTRAASTAFVAGEVAAEATTRGDADTALAASVQAVESSQVDLDAAAVKLTGAQSVAGVKTFASSPVLPTPALSDASTKAANMAAVAAEVAIDRERLGSLDESTSLRVDDYRLLIHADDTAAILAAKAALPADGGELKFRRDKVYVVSSQVLIQERWVGEAVGKSGALSPNGATLITSTFDGAAFLVPDNTYDWGIEGIVFKGDDALTSQDLLTFGQGAGVGEGSVRNVAAIEAGRDNIVLNFCLNTHFDHVTAVGAGRHGWRITSQSNSNKFTKCMSRLSVQWGVYAQGGLSNNFDSFTIESNSRSTTTYAVTAVAATDLFTATGHGLAAGDAVRFSALTGGAGITAGLAYYVIASGLTANAFKVSTAPDGSTIDVTSDLTAGTLSPVYGGLWARGNVSGVEIHLDACHLESNHGPTGAGVPLRVDVPDTAGGLGPTVLSEINTEYSEANPLLLNGGRFTSVAARTVMQPVHAVIGAAHGGAVVINPWRWGTGATTTGSGSFGLTDSSNKSIVIGDGISEGKPGIKIGGDTVIYRDAADTWGMLDRLKWAVPVDTVIRESRRTGEGSPRMIEYVDGQRELGPGNAATDTKMSRNGAVSGGGVWSVTKAIELAAKATAANMPNNTLFVDTADNLLKWRDNAGVLKTVTLA